MDTKVEDVLTLMGWGVFWVVLLWCITSCGVYKNCRNMALERDSVYVERVDSVFLKDTILLYQPQDSTASNVVADTEKSHLETDIATSDAWVADGQLHHELRNKTELVPIKAVIPNYISREERYLTKTVIREVEKDLKWYQQTLMYMGIVLLIIILIKLLWRRNLG